MRRLKNMVTQQGLETIHTYSFQIGKTHGLTHIPPKYHVCVSEKIGQEKTQMVEVRSESVPRNRNHKSRLTIAISKLQPFSAGIAIKSLVCNHRNRTGQRIVAIRNHSLVVAIRFAGVQTHLVSLKQSKKRKCGGSGV